MKIAATVTKCAQFGVDSFRDIHTTKVFDAETARIRDILTWASKELGSQVNSIGAVQLSDYSE